MKHCIYPTLAALCALACTARADATNIYGGLDAASATEIVSDGTNTDVVLNPNASAPSSDSYFKANNNTVSSVSTSNESIFNVIGDETNGSTTTIDIAQAGDGEFSAFENNGRINLGRACFEIVNLAGSSAVANINVGSMRLNPGSNAYGSAYGFDVKTNAYITGEAFNASGLDSGGEYSVRISNNSNVVWAVDNSEFELNTGILVDNGSTLTIKKPINFSNGSVLEVCGKLVFDRAAANAGLSVSKLNLSGTLTTTGGGISLWGTSQISKTGVLESTGDINFTGTLTVESGGRIVIKQDPYKTATSKIIIGSHNTLELKSENAVSMEGGSTPRVDLGVDYNGGKLTLGADNMFGNLAYLDSAANTLTIQLNGSHVYFDGITFNYPNYGGKFTIEKFDEQLVFFKDIDGWDNITSVTLTAVDGQQYTKDQLYLIEGTYLDGTKGYWLSTSSVPEPAEYAAILGAIAIAFALKRRCSKK